VIELNTLLAGLEQTIRHGSSEKTPQVLADRLFEKAHGQIDRIEQAMKEATALRDRLRSL
jgi:hypothetical protein